MVGLFRLEESAITGTMTTTPELGWTGGTRIPVAALFENLEDGVSLADFVDLFPGVSLEQVRMVLEGESDSAGA